MEGQDLKCPYCSKLCDNRGNRDKHVAACKRSRESGKKAKHGQHLVSYKKAAEPLCKHAQMLKFCFMLTASCTPNSLKTF